MTAQPYTMLLADSLRWFPRRNSGKEKSRQYADLSIFEALGKNARRVFGQRQKTAITIRVRWTLEMGKM
jgi:hypothetical protein